jgi:hypothetical protein
LKYVNPRIKRIDPSWIAEKEKAKINANNNKEKERRKTKEVRSSKRNGD